MMLPVAGFRLAARPPTQIVGMLGSDDGDGRSLTEGVLLM